MQINLNSDKGNLRRHATESDVNPQLQAALAEREKFLMRYPHMRSYQAEIDRILDKSGNAQGRMAVLGMLLQGKVLELQRELYKMTLILGEAAKSSQ